ncbi:MAG: AI-2E family transporter [Actinobacteria bacterium]|nr:MAG: AI-2E family transporter [Actinomycetota bacterium]
MAKNNSLSYVDLERLVIFIILLLLGFRFIQLTAEVIILFALVTLLFLLLNPVVVWLEKRGLNRTWASIVTIVTIILIIVLILIFALQPITNQINLLIEEVPDIADELLGNIQRISKGFPILENITSKLDLTKIITAPTPLFRRISAISQNLIGSIFFAILSIFLIVFMLSNPKPVITGFLQFFPKDKINRVREGIILLSSNLATWFYSALLIGTINGVIVGIGFVFIGVQFPLLFAILYILAEFVPLVGPLAVALMAVLFALSQSFVTFILVLILLAVVQILEATLWSPLILAHRLNLHPLSIVFAILTAEVLIGISGAILAIPALLTIKIFYYEFYTRDFPTHFLSIEAEEVMEMQIKHGHRKKGF